MTGIPLIVLSRLRSTTAITKTNNSQRERYHLYYGFSRRAVATRVSKNFACPLQRTWNNQSLDGTIVAWKHTHTKYYTRITNKQSPVLSTRHKKMSSSCPVMSCS